MHITYRLITQSRVGLFVLDMTAVLVKSRWTHFSKEWSFE